jgi:hypothetical protein
VSVFNHACRKTEFMLIAVKENEGNAASTVAIHAERSTAPGHGKIQRLNATHLKRAGIENCARDLIAPAVERIDHSARLEDLARLTDGEMVRADALALIDRPGRCFEGLLQEARHGMISVSRVTLARSATAVAEWPIMLEQSLLKLVNPV